jgi:hypothetical protein
MYKRVAGSEFVGDGSIKVKNLGADTILFWRCSEKGCPQGKLLWSIAYLLATKTGIRWMSHGA